MSRKRPLGMTSLEWRQREYHRKKSESEASRPAARVPTNNEPCESARNVAHVTLELAEEDREAGAENVESDSERNAADQESSSDGEVSQGERSSEEDGATGENSQRNAADQESSTDDEVSQGESSSEEEFQIQEDEPEAPCTVNEIVLKYSNSYSLTQAQIKGLLTFLRHPLFPHTSLQSLPQDPRTLLGLSNPPFKPRDDNFIYYGIANCLERMIHITRAKQLPSTIELYMNADGLPLFSRTHSLTPVLICSNLDPCLVGIVSIYHSQVALSNRVSSPGRKSQAYLSPFIDEMNTLSSNKFMGVPVVLKYVTCDLVALAEMKTIKAHTAKHACPRCCIIGETKRSRMTFRHEGHPCMPRTNESYRDRVDRLHHHPGVKSEFESEQDVNMATFHYLETSLLRI